MQTKTHRPQTNAAAETNSLAKTKNEDASPADEFPSADDFPREDEDEDTFREAVIPTEKSRTRKEQPETKERLETGKNRIRKQQTRNG